MECQKNGLYGGTENERHENVRHEIAGPENAGHKMLDL